MKLLSIFLALNSICGTVFLNKNIETNALRKEEYNNIGLSLGKKSSTTAFDIKDVMSEYCKRKGINSNHYAMLLSTVANINMCIQDNKPIALFGNFVRPDNGKKVNHAVTCYGTRDVPLGQGQTNRYFIVNFGWTGYSRVYL